jgi:hypothetical protein
MITLDRHGKVCYRPETEKDHSAMFMSVALVITICGSLIVFLLASCLNYPVR